jgi:hypothetical protein
VNALIVNLALLNPYLDEQTFAVMHVDMTQLDVAALRKNLARTELLGRLEGAIEKWKDSFTQAGGKDVFLVFSLADNPVQGFLVIPCTVETSAGIKRTLAAPEFETILRSLQFLMPSQDYHHAVQIGDAFVIGNRFTTERLPNNKPTERPELKKAFETVATSTIQLALVPTADQRRVLEEMEPTLPAILGGGSIQVVTRGMLWSVLGIEVGPKVSLRWYAQSQDAASAQAFKQWLETTLGNLSSNAVTQRYFSHFGQLVGILKPRASGDHVELALNEGEPALSLLLQGLSIVLDLAAGRTWYGDHLHEIALAMHNFHGRYQTFPAIGSFDKNGRPLLSWRVLILPWLNQEELFKKFHLDEPWDSEHNKALLPLIPEVYRPFRLTDKPLGFTTILGPVGKNLFFTGDQKKHSIADITDGTSNSIMLVQTDSRHAVPWTKPEDLSVDKHNPTRGLADHPPGVMALGFADGSVHFVSHTSDKETLYHLFTINGGEVIDPSKLK